VSHPAVILVLSTAGARGFIRSPRAEGARRHAVTADELADARRNAGLSVSGRTRRRGGVVLAQGEGHMHKRMVSVAASGLVGILGLAPEARPQSRVDAADMPIEVREVVATPAGVSATLVNRSTQPIAGYVVGLTYSSDPAPQHFEAMTATDEELQALIDQIALTMARVPVVRGGESVLQPYVQVIAGLKRLQGRDPGAPASVAR